MTHANPNDDLTVTRCFLVDVQYRTKRGRDGRWMGEVEASWMTVHRVAVDAAHKARPSIGKVELSRAVTAEQGRP